ncbi:hypothetical protein SLEP1_g7959 [Rubroshorea leprosula]|uniref:HMA domain-containing protein n=1 Tax=Rubroshorea leprosula TaxID=152421 RepID=A0AAV5I031_9ROSI|nr:hypothetical protein SLEP1_g7959 [Rubroshorea leprosula]
MVRTIQPLRTVLKVNISCCKCKKKILKAITSIQGIDKIETDVAKGTVMVTGNADPFEIIVCTRKAAKYAEVDSIGPPPSPSKESDEKSQKDTDGENPPKMHPTCSVCEPIAIVHVADVPCSTPCSLM